MTSISETGTSPLGRLWLYMLAALILLFLVFPIFIVIPMSFSASQYLEFPPSELSLRWYRAYFESVEWLDATWVSLRVGALTVALALPLGVAASYGLQVAQSRWVQPIRAMLMTPIIIPVVIISIGVFYLFARIALVNTILGLVLAHTALAIPFVLVTVTAALMQYDLDQEKVARSLGATRVLAFVTITIPQIARSIISAALLAFMTSLDEVVVALLISMGEKSTLTRRMFSSLRDQIDPTIAAISTILIVGSLLVVALSGIQWSGMTQRAAMGERRPAPSSE